MALLAFGAAARWSGLFESPVILVLGGVAVLAGLGCTLALVLRRRRFRRARVIGEIVLRRVQFDRGRDDGARFLFDVDLALPGRSAITARYAAIVPHQLTGSAVPGARFACEARPDDPTRVRVQFRPDRPDDYVEFMPPWQDVTPDLRR